MPADPSPPELSVILPAFNEAEGLKNCVDAIERTVAAEVESYEILLINDGSSDDTAAIADALAAERPPVLAVHLSRNFGKEAAMCAGIDAAQGQAVLVLDADMQHPPDLIPLLLARWREGFDVVNAVKNRRGEESLAYRSFAGAFNALMRRASPALRDFEGASDFKLLDRQAIDALRACPERSRFFRGLVAWVGFRVCNVPFDVMPRAAGESRWSTRALLRYALQNLLAFTSEPLRWIAGLGAVAVIAALLLGAQTLYRYIHGTALTGFTTVILVQILLSALILLSLGVISLYIAELYDEAKRRPIYIVRRPRDYTTRDDTTRDRESR